MSALIFYNASGWKQIDLDWTVENKISSITKPLDKKSFFIDEKELVASGEQSFLQLMNDNKLKPGRYCGITPCFRDDEEDYLHSKYFMKVELIDTLKGLTNNQLSQIVAQVLNAYREKTSLLGYRIEPLIDNYETRNILI